MSSNAGGPKVDDEGFVTPNPGQGHYKGTSGGGNTKVDAETGETAAVLSSSNDPDPRSSVTGRGGADQTGGIANAPGIDAAQGSNLGSGTSKGIGSTTRTGPAQYQGTGH